MNKNLSIFLTFSKIGAITFGGGYAMISIIKQEIVDKYHWLTDDELTEIIAIAESTPGPIAINMATYVGYNRTGILGSILATLGVVIPSVVIILIISLFLDAFMSNNYVMYAFEGIKCGVALLILQAGCKLFKMIKKSIPSIILFLLVFILCIVFEIYSISYSSIYFLLSGGLLGLIYYLLSLKHVCKDGEDK